MEAPKYHQSRLDFQFERFLFFSDGVMAIIITLMVLDIRVPEMLTIGEKKFEILTDTQLQQALSKMILKFVGYLISFGIVGHYWSVHHRIFGYVIKYDTKLIWLNLGYLFTVALLPFSSALLGEYSVGEKIHMHTPYLVYVCNICLVALFNVLMWLYVSSPKRKFLTHSISSFRITLGVYRSLVLPGVFVVSYLIAFISPVFARFIPLSIPFILQYGMNGVERNMLAQEARMEESKLKASEIELKQEQPLTP